MPRDRLARLPEALSSVVTVQGAPGSGRTTLLRAVVALARRRGVRVAAATAVPFESGLPYAVAEQLLAKLVPPTPEDPRSGGRVADQLSSALLAATPDAPLLVVVDDLQWADEQSHRLLFRLLHLAYRRPVMFVFATDGTRPTFADIELSTLPDNAAVLPLAPLGPAAVRSLVQRTCSTAPDGEFARGAEQVTGGNPAVLCRTLRAFDLTGLSPTATAVSRFVSLAEAVRAEQVSAALGALPAEALGVLRVLAAVDADLDFDLIATLVDPAVAVRQQVEVLRRAGLLTREGPPRPADRVTARRVLAEMPRAQRVALTAQAAELAYRFALDDADVARLVLLTSPTPTGWAAPLLRRAAHASRAADAHADAARLLRRALREPVSGDQRARLLLDLAATEATEASAASDRALVDVVLVGDDIDPDLRLTATHMLLARGDAFTARAVLAGWRPAPGRAGAESVAVLGRLIECRLHGTVDLDELPPPDPAVCPDQAGLTAWCLAAQGGDIERVRELARATLAPPSGARVARPLFRLAACTALGLADDVTEAETGLGDILVTARRGRDQVVAAAALLRLAQLRLHRGQLNEAEAYLRESQAEFPLRCWDPLARPTPIALEILVAVERGRLDEAERVAATALPALAERGFEWSHLLFAKGVLAMAAGKPQAAARLLLECGRRLTGGGCLNPALLPWRSTAAIALTMRAQYKEALRLFAEEQQLATEWGAPSALGQAHLNRGTVFGDALAPHFLALAEQTLRDSPARLRHAHALLAVAERGVDTGTGVSGAALLRQAEDLAAACGAILPPGRTFATAVPPEIPVGEPATHQHQGELSSAESRVVGMAAGGMTNVQIASSLGISRRMVEQHLTRAYRKLGVSGRDKLSAALPAMRGEE